MAAKTSALEQLSTTNIILVTLLVSVVVVVGGVFIAQHLFGELRLNQKISSKKGAAAQQLAVNLQTAPTLVQRYNQQTPLAQQEITDALPSTPDIPGLVAMMEHLTGVSGVALQTLSPSVAVAPGTAKVPTGGPQPVDFSATVSGTYPNLLKFLANLQLSARPIQLSTLSVSGGGSGVTVQLSLETDYEAAPGLALGTETVK